MSAFQATNTILLVRIRMTVSGESGENSRDLGGEGCIGFNMGMC
jgi:hypothetical protein